MDLHGVETEGHLSSPAETFASDIERPVSAPPRSQSIQPPAAQGRKASDVSYFKDSSRSDIGYGNFAGNDCIVHNHYHDSAIGDHCAVQKAFERGRLRGRQDMKQEDAIYSREQEISTREHKVTKREEEAKEREQHLSSREKQLQKLEHELRTLRQNMITVASGSGPKLNETLLSARYSPDLVRAFGDYAPGLDQYIRGFDFSAISTDSNSKRYSLSIPFAPFYGDLDKQHMAWLSDHLKFTISSVVRTLQRTRLTTELSWDSAHAALVSAHHIEEARNAEQWHVCVDLPNDAVDWGQLVNSWIVAVMGIPENGMSLASTTNTIFGLALAQRGDHKCNAKHASTTENLADVTVLRFPVAGRRAFSLSRVRLSIVTQVCKSRSGILGRDKRRVSLRGGA